MNQDTKQTDVLPIAITDQIVRQQEEIERLKAEVMQLRGCLPSIDTYKLAMDERAHFAQECERLKSENAILRNAQKACEDCDAPTLAETKRLKAENAKLESVNQQLRNELRYMLDVVLANLEVIDDRHVEYALRLVKGEKK